MDSTKTIPYTVSVREVNQSTSRPALESFVAGRDGNEVLFIGGRISGFHGVGDADGFHSSNSNSSFVVIDFETGNSWTHPVPEAYLQQFSSTNMQHCQEGDTLWFTGGYGIDGDGDKANYTCKILTAVSVSQMISAVKAKDDTGVANAILYRIEDDLVQVTGGEMLKIGNRFYLVMGQNFKGEYTPGSTGEYTDEVRSFEVDESNKKLINKSQLKYQDDSPDQFHRRDLNVCPTIIEGKVGFSVYGGVFTADDNGWLNPIHFFTGDDGLGYKLDQIEQISNNYACASIPVYDDNSGTMYVSFLGGIGYKQWDEGQKKMVPGDGPVPLPFVKTISTLGHPTEGSTIQHTQIPGDEPTLPELLGAEALFLPNVDLLLNQDILDFGKCSAQSEMQIGYMYGGIRATAPTSSQSSPTYGSNKIFEVIMKQK